MRRKLATIQPINAVVPIPGAERIEALKILGWTVVDQKGLYRAGDLCVFCEIDSLMPAEYFPVLQKHQYRISTVKLRGQVSQGFCISMPTFFEIVRSKGGVVRPGEVVLQDGTTIPLCAGVEVTELVGISKWEPPAHLLVGDFCGSFPSHLVSKTDQPRVQAYPGVIDELYGRPYIITVKLDGDSATYVVDHGEFCACARDNKRSDGDNVYWNMARKYNLREILSAHKNFAVQGEICGPGIHGNRLGLSSHEFFLYGVTRIDDRSPLDYDQLCDWGSSVGLKAVPLFERGDCFSYSFDQVISLADGYYDGTKNRREGLVFEHKNRSYQSVALRDRLSFKAISNLYLMKGGN